MRMLIILSVFSSILFAQEGSKSSFEKGFEYGLKSCEKKYCFCKYTYGQYPANYQPVVVIKGKDYPLSAAMGEYRCYQKLSEVPVCSQ